MPTPFVPHHPGTIEVTNGSKTFIGDGTNFTAYDPYDSIYVDDHEVLIEEVVDDEEFTAVFEYSGTSGADKDYRWVPLPDLTRSLSYLTEVQRHFASGNLPAFGDLVGEADVFPYFTGPGTLALAEVLPANRTMLAQAGFGAPEQFPLMANNATDATHDIDFGAASLWDHTLTSRASIPAMTKQADADWSAAGTGGKYSGDAFANGTVHWYAAWKADGSDGTYFADTDPDPEAALVHLQAMTGGDDYAYIQRVGSIPIETGAFVAFAHKGRQWLRKTVLGTAADANPGTSAVLSPIGVPTGIQVDALFSFAVSDTTNSTSFYRAIVTSPDQADSAAASARFTLIAAAESARMSGSMSLKRRTNTNGEIRYRLENSYATLTVRTYAEGWEDDRGRS